MNREQYLRELEARLSNRMSPQELEHIVRYYNEYFDEAGPEGEEKAVEDLGSPADLTRRILGEQVIKDLERRAADEPDGGERPRRRGLWSVWTVILAICAAPIAIPVAIGLIAAAVGLLLGIFAVFVGLGIAGVACVGMGIVSAVWGFTNLLVGGLATTMYFVGGGMLVGGIGILLLGGAFGLSGLCLRGLARLLGRMLHRRERAV